MKKSKEELIEIAKQFIHDANVTPLVHAKEGGVIFLEELLADFVGYQDRLRLEDFTKIPAGKIFATGVLPNTPIGLYMTEFKKGDNNLRWIAKKGHGEDWTIYCDWEGSSEDYIAKHGQKVETELNIQKCIDIDRDVLSRYRY